MYGSNEEIDENGIIDEESPDDTLALDASSREFLDAAIADYIAIFKTNYDTSSEKFNTADAVLILKYAAGMITEF